MGSVDLSKYLDINSYEERELLTVLQTFFTLGVQTDTYELKMFLNDYDQQSDYYALKCTFSNGKRKLLSIKTGPGFPVGEEQKIKQELEKSLADNGKRIANVVMFSSLLSVKDEYLMGDLFQILPLEEDEKEKEQYKHFMRFYPFRLKFKYDDSPNDFVRMGRSREKAHELQLLLNVFLNVHITNKNLHKSTECPSQIEEGWTKTSEELKSMRKINTQKYYYEAPYPYTSVQISEMFDFHINKFYSLERPLQEQFLRAAYWYQHSGEVMDISRSAAYIALVNSIETLAADESKLIVCEKCGNKAGATKQVREFLKKYIPGIESSEINKVYGLRSSLTHGKRILEMDTGKFNDFTPLSGQDNNSYFRTDYLTRAALLNWLCSQKS
ncbi:hypothetical protein [Priestia aryabhattai]